MCASPPESIRVRPSASVNPHPRVRTCPSGSSLGYPRPHLAVYPHLPIRASRSSPADPPPAAWVFWSASGPPGWGRLVLTGAGFALAGLSKQPPFHTHLSESRPGLPPFAALLPPFRRPLTRKVCFYPQSNQSVTVCRPCRPKWTDFSLHSVICLNHIPIETL